MHDPGFCSDLRKLGTPISIETPFRYEQLQGNPPKESQSGPFIC